MSVLQDARKYAEENGLFFMEASAKTAINVNDIFYEIGMVLNFICFQVGKVRCIGGRYIYYSSLSGSMVYSRW